MNKCDKCEIRQLMARAFDLHWHGEDDCPFECQEQNEDDCPFECQEQNIVID